MRIRISRGRIIDPANGRDEVTDLFIDSNQIVAIGKAPEGFTAEQEYDASNCIVCPGFIDLAARFREPGFSNKGTILSESRAASAGGVTSVCCPPDTRPVIDNAAVAELIHQRASEVGQTRIYPIGALTHGLEGKTLSGMATLKDAGCIAMSNGYNNIENTEVLRRAMEYASTCDLPLMLYCEDPYLKNQGTCNEGIISLRLGLPGIPAIAESIDVNRVLMLAEHTGCRVHFCRLSAAQSIELIRTAKARGQAITADVSIHHLYLTENDVDSFNSQCHFRPPLRCESDRQALRQALIDGTIDCVVSDHQPHDSDAKNVPYSLTEAGASSIELLLPLMLKMAAEEQLELMPLLALISSKPAELLGIPVAGSLSVGSAADICVFEANTLQTVDARQLISRGKNTPFHGWQLPGKVRYTFIEGKAVFSA